MEKKQRKARAKRSARYEVTFTVEVELDDGQDLCGAACDVANAVTDVMDRRKQGVFDGVKIVDSVDYGATFVDETTPSANAPIS